MKENELLKKIEELEKRILTLEQRELQKPTTPQYWLPSLQPAANPNLHYHNGSPCYKNPCIWC